MNTSLTETETSPENTITTSEVNPHISIHKHNNVDGHKRPRKTKKPWYMRLLKRCGYGSRRRYEKLAMAKDADEAFWATFYRAYDALCTPVILGEIEKVTLDVKIVYANAAACEFTGYAPGQVSRRNPNGLVGRSVSDLMEESLAQAHPRFVENWLHRRGILQSRDTFVHSVDSVDSGGSTSTGRNRMKAVEGISRRVTMVTLDGRSLTTDAALSFFTAKGLKKVVGIFSFKSAEQLEVVSFQGMTFNLKYAPMKSDTSYHVVVKTPPQVSQFSEDDLWSITAVSEGIILKSGDIKFIKKLIRQQIFYHLSKISYASQLNFTFVHQDKHSLSSFDMRKSHAGIVESINMSRSENNMHLSVKHSKKMERLYSSGSFYDMDVIQDF